MASRSAYPFLFLPFLALFLAGVLGLFALMAPSLLRTTPQAVGGAAQIADTLTPAEQYAAVTTEAAPLAPAEEPRRNPQGDPAMQPQGSPAAASPRYPDSGAR